MRKTWLALVALLAIAAWAGDKLAWAADPYPSRQLTYLICFDPGGQSDREARRQQAHLTRIMGQKVLIDYKVGGGGAMGWKELVRSKPDGYLFAGFNIPHVILQPLQQEVGYKTDQIVPVVLFQRTPLALAVLKDSPYQTLEDFIKDAKANPGKLTVGGSAVFSGPHFGTMQFEKAAGVKLTYVPFTGSAPQMTAFLGGHTVACMGNSDDLVRFKDSSGSWPRHREAFLPLPRLSHLQGTGPGSLRGHRPRRGGASRHAPGDHRQAGGGLPGGGQEPRDRQGDGCPGLRAPGHGGQGDQGPHGPPGGPLHRLGKGNQEVVITGRTACGKRAVRPWFRKNVRHENPTQRRSL